MWARLVGPEAIWGHGREGRGVAPAWTDMGWSRKNVLFLLLCPVSTRPPTPELTLARQQKVCSELVTAEMRMVAYPTVTSPPCSVKASPGAHEANKAPVTTTDLGSDESRRSRSSFGFDTAEDNSFMDVEDLICQRPEMVMESE